MILIFSKFDMAGGSERRCVELANGIARHTCHQAVIAAEGGFPESLRSFIEEDVDVYEKALLKPQLFADAGCVIVVNTDCKEFSTADYWDGKSHRHNIPIPLGSISKMVFVYNFLVSPSRHLHTIAKWVPVSIACTNRKFFDEITKQDRYENVRTIPRYILTSPIDPMTVTPRVRREAKVFGCHSKGGGSKWNSDWPRLVEEVGKRSESEFKFMGMKKDLAKETGSGYCYKENQMSVGGFLNQLDVFCFMPSYKREEPWARVIAEAMMAGLPIIALNRGGTPDQVLQNHNGILCKNFNDYHKAIVYMEQHPVAVKKMSENSLRIAKNFTTEKVIEMLMEIAWK